MPPLTPPSDPVRIEAGGSITFDDGTNTFAVTLYEPGSLQETIGGIEGIEFTDRGVQKKPVLGDDQMSDIALGFKLASTSAADNILRDFLMNASADGYVREFSVTINRPDYRGAGAGWQHVWTECHIPAGGLSIASGGAGAFDVVSLNLRSRDTQPSTWTRY